MMLSLCPKEWNFIKITGSSAVGYLDYIFSTKFDTKWVLNLDEDCFLLNYEMIYDLIKYMETNDYDYCGIQDGGSIPVRIHNPLVSNPFFNLFNVEKINPLKKDYFDRKYSMDELKKKYSHFIRFDKCKSEYDLYERFYHQFFWLLENGMKPFYLDCREFSQEKYFVISPILRIVPYFNSPTMLCSHKGEDMALHTWHSRYINYRNIRKRIMNCYNHALNSSIHANKKVYEMDLSKRNL
jgi:hypothetical protein